MGIDTESSKKYEEQWWQDRFKGYSKEELQKIKESDEARKADQKEVNRIVADAVSDPESNAWDKKKLATHEAAKKKKLEEIYSDD